MFKIYFYILFEFSSGSSMYMYMQIEENEWVASPQFDIKSIICMELYVESRGLCLASPPIIFFTSQMVIIGYKIIYDRFILFYKIKFKFYKWNRHDIKR
jgi:hypothetical protein